MGKSDCPSNQRGDNHPKEDLVFSMIDGFVLASWPGTTASVKLGNRSQSLRRCRIFFLSANWGSGSATPSGSRDSVPWWGTKHQPQRRIAVARFRRGSMQDEESSLDSNQH